MLIMTKTTKSYQIFSATFAFILWGGWGYYVNSNHSNFTGLTSGLTQGIISFVLTLSVVYLVTYFYNRIPQKVLRISFPPIAAIMCFSGVSASVHYFADTPHILISMSPSLLMALIFAYLTIYQLEKRQGNKLLVEE